MAPSGLLHFVGIARSQKKGLERILSDMRNELSTKPAHVAVMHAYAPEKAEQLRRQIESELCCSELWITEFSPLMGYACGTGALGVAYYHDD